MIFRPESPQIACFMGVFNAPGLLHIFRTTGNSQYDGHGRDAIDSAGGYSLASRASTFALDENGR